MAGFRVFGTSHCMLFQLPAPLRQCSSIHTPLLPRPHAPLARLFHASAIQAVRKPSRAIIQPNKPSSSPPPAKKRPSSPPKKLHIPFIPHPPTSSPQAPPLQPSAQPQSRPVTAPPSSTPIQVEQKQSEAPSTLPAVKTPQEYVAPTAQRVARYQSFVNQLATRPAPTIVYAARSQTIFVTTCVASAIFMTYCAWINIPTVRFATNAGAVGLLITTSICALGMSVASVAFGVGPHHLIKRIVAIPAAAAKEAHAGERAMQNLRPTLRFEPVRVVFGLWPKPFEVPLGDVVSDRPFALEMEKWASKPTTNVFSRIFSAFWAMFARREYFSYVRVEGRGNWKLHLQDAQTLDQGRALDKLIKVDQKTVHWKLKLVR